MAGDEGLHILECGAARQAHRLPHILKKVVKILARIQSQGEEEKLGIGPAWQAVFELEESSYPPVLLVCHGDLGRAEHLVRVVAGHLRTHEKTRATQKRQRTNQGEVQKSDAYVNQVGFLRGGFLGPQHLLDGHVLEDPPSVAVYRGQQHGKVAIKLPLHLLRRVIFQVCYGQEKSDVKVQSNTRQVRSEGKTIYSIDQGWPAPPGSGT